MDLQQLPIPDQPLTIARIEAAMTKRGVWKPCSFCGAGPRALAPTESNKQCISLSIIDFESDKPAFRTANLAVVCLNCGHSDIFDYVLLNQFVFRTESGQ